MQTDLSRWENQNLFWCLQLTLNNSHLQLLSVWHKMSCNVIFVFLEVLFEGTVCLCQTLFLSFTTTNTLLKLV